MSLTQLPRHQLSHIQYSSEEHTHTSCSDMHRVASYLFEQCLATSPVCLPRSAAVCWSLVPPPAPSPGTLCLGLYLSVAPRHSHWQEWVQDLNRQHSVHESGTAEGRLSKSTGLLQDWAITGTGLLDWAAAGTGIHYALLLHVEDLSLPVASLSSAAALLLRPLDV